MGKKPYKKWSSPHSQQKSPKCSTWVQSQKQQNDLGSLPMQNIQYHNNLSLCPNHWCHRRWWTVPWRPARPSRTNTKKRCSFHQRELEWRSKKSRDTWSNRQIWPWSTEWNRAKANWVWPRERTGHNKHPLPTTREKTVYMDITRWSTPKSDWLYSLQPKMEKLYNSQQKQDQELTVTQIMNSLLPNSDLNWRK